MKMLIWVALALAAMMGAAAAQGSPQEQAACRPDARRFCSQLGKADQDAYRECLQSHFNALSPKCQQVMTSH